MATCLKAILPAIVITMVTGACTNQKHMTQYKALPKVYTLKEAQLQYGNTVKLYATLVKEPLMNHKTVVEPEAFFFRLAEGQLILLPTKNADPVTVQSYTEMAGKSIFVVGTPMPPGPLSPYQGLETPYFEPRGLVTAADDETFTKPEISSAAGLDRLSSQVAAGDTFFAYIAGKMEGRPDAGGTFPQTVKIQLQDGAEIEAVINEKSDMDILSVPDEKVFVRGRAGKTAGKYRITNARVTNYSRYMDLYSKE